MPPGRRLKSDWTARVASYSTLHSFSWFLFLRDKKKPLPIFLNPFLQKTVEGKSRMIMPVNRKECSLYSIVHSLHSTDPTWDLWIYKVELILCFVLLCFFVLLSSSRKVLPDLAACGEDCKMLIRSL